MRVAPILAISLLALSCSNNDEVEQPPSLFDDDTGSPDTSNPDEGFSLDSAFDVSTPPSTCGDGAPAPSGKIKCPSGASGTDLPKATSCGPGSGACTYVAPCGLDKWNCCGTWEKIAPDVPACSLCPTTQPTTGSACPKENLLCAYAKTGGTYCEWTETYCNAGKWSVTPKACDASCPKAQPKTGDLCDPTSTGAFCIWASPCHSQAYGQCSGSKWVVTSPCP